MAFLSIEGVGLIIGGGDCPMGRFQEQLGDPVPFFELVLPPRAAKAAISSGERNLTIGPLTTPPSQTR